MNLNTLDWIIILLFFIVLISIAVFASRSAGKSYSDFSVGEEYALVVAGREHGSNHFFGWYAQSGNRYCTPERCGRKLGLVGFLLTGMLTVFVYAKLWNRSKVLTDLEFYEIRYSGKMAAFLRGFRAIYLGFSLMFW